MPGGQIPPSAKEKGHAQSLQHINSDFLAVLRQALGISWQSRPRKFPVFKELSTWNTCMVFFARSSGWWVTRDEKVRRGASGTLQHHSFQTQTHLSLEHHRRCGPSPADAPEGQLLLGCAAAAHGDFAAMRTHVDFSIHGRRGR